MEPMLARVQVRRRELQEGMERQFKQSMTAPDWEMEDYEWQASLNLVSLNECSASDYHPVTLFCSYVKSFAHSFSSF